MTLATAELLIVPYCCKSGVPTSNGVWDARAQALSAKGFAGNPVVAFNFTDAGKVYPNPFANGTSYSFPDEVTVMGHSEKTTSHTVYRSVTDYISSQQHEAHASAHAGMFFKASVATSWASSHMSDSLHIVAVSQIFTHHFKTLLGNI